MKVRKWPEALGEAEKQRKELEGGQPSCGLGQVQVAVTPRAEDRAGAPRSKGKIMRQAEGPHWGALPGACHLSCTSLTVAIAVPMPDLPVAPFHF